MRRPGLIVVFLLLAHAASVAAAEKTETWTFSPQMLQPFWRSDVMHGESVLFVGEGDDRPKASLLFAPTRIVSVCDSAGKIVYEEGRDYVFQPGTKEIVLPPGSRIVNKKPEDLRRPAGSQPYRLTHRDGNGEILFGASHEYHDMQTCVTYAHDPDAWKGYAPSFAGDRLPRTVEKLGAKRPLEIVVFGDSISTGCNASGWSGTPPFQPAYYDLLAMNLQSVYGGKASVRNFSVGGMDTEWGAANIGKVIEAKPDLVILAFGMNDSAGRSVESYQANTRAMVESVKKALPEAEIILVATMLGNKDWTVLKQESFPAFRDALAGLCGSGVALADMTSVWAEMLKYKQDRDLTGNGVNHPNDFGHRVYAQVLSALLIRDRS